MSDSQLPAQPQTESGKNIHKQAFWLFGVIVGLAIKEAVVEVVPHIIKPSELEEQGAILPEAMRLVVFLVLIIRFYLGATLYFDEESYFKNGSDIKLLEKAYNFDFLFSFAHFLLFVALAISIKADSRPRYVFPIILGAILLYDLFWWLMRRREPRQMISTWTVLNLLSILLVVGVYSVSKQFGVSAFRSEIIAYVPLLLVSFIDIRQITSGENIFSAWLEGLGQKLRNRR